MKKLLILILIALALSGKGNDKYLFTDTKTDLNGNLPADPVTWIFDTNDKQLTLKTETQDVIYSICKVQKIESILGYYKKYSLSNGCAVYVHSDSLDVIFCTDSAQYYFTVASDKFYSKNN